MNKKKKSIEEIDYAITIRKRKKFIKNTKKLTFFVFFLDIFLIVLYDRIVKKRMV